MMVVVVIAELLPTFCMHPLKAWTGGSKGERIERSDTPPIHRCWICIILNISGNTNKNITKDDEDDKKT